MPALRIPLQDRFWDKVVKTDTCWVWTGGKFELGYGKITEYLGIVNGRKKYKEYRAHVLSWT